VSTIHNSLGSWTDGDQKLLKLGGSICFGSAIYGFFNPQDFFVAYLLGYLFVAGIVFGAMPLHMIQNLTGGKWRVPTRGILEAILKTIPFIAIALIPLLFGLNHLYQWADKAHMLSDPHLARKIPYLNVPFFLVRMVIFFTLWIGIIHWLLKWSAEIERTHNRRIESKLQLLSGLGIVAYSLTMSFASYDWLMSLDPKWFSTMFGPLFIAGNVLMAHAVTLAGVGYLIKKKPLKEAVNADNLHDAGNLLLAFVMLWTYFSFSQFIIIWLANLPEEIPWYLHRFRHGWKSVGRSIMFFHFAVPFILLLMRSVKRNIEFLSVVACGLIFMRFIHLIWLIIPEFEKSVFHIHGGVRGAAILCTKQMVLTDFGCLKPGCAVAARNNVHFDAKSRHIKAVQDIF